MAKSKTNKLVALIIGLVALVCMVLSTVSVFFTCIVNENSEELNLSASRVSFGCMMSDETAEENVIKATFSGDEKEIEIASKNYMVHQMGSYNDSTRASTVVLMLTTLLTMLFGAIGTILSIFGVFGKARKATTVFAILTAICGLAGIICCATIVGELEIWGLAMGCSTILTLVFAVIAAGLQITNQVLFGKKKA